MNTAKFRMNLSIVLAIVVIVNIGSHQALALTENAKLTTQAWTQVTGTDCFTLAFDNPNVISDNDGEEIAFIANTSAPADYQKEHYICASETETLNASDFFIEVTVEYEFSSFNESGNIILNMLTDYDEDDPETFSTICYIAITHQEANNMTNFDVYYTHDSGAVGGARPMDTYTMLDAVIFRANRTGSDLSIEIVDPNDDTVILSEQTSDVINDTLDYILIDYETNSRNEGFNATISDCTIMLDATYEFPENTTLSFPTAFTFNFGYSSLPILLTVGIMLYLGVRKVKRK